VSQVADVREVEGEHPALKLQYGFNHRHHGSVKRAVEVVRAGKLGRVTKLLGAYIKMGIEGWRADRALAGGGILLDQGIHMLDIMRLLAGEFVQVTGGVSRKALGLSVEDDAYVMMYTAGGTSASLHSSAHGDRHLFFLHVEMERGSMTLDGILSGSMAYAPETIEIDGQRSVYTVDRSWSDEVAEFVACIREDVAVKNGSSHDAMQAMRLVERVYAVEV